MVTRNQVIFEKYWIQELGDSGFPHYQCFGGFGIIEKPKILTRKKYLEIEKKIAKKLELSLAELDLYL